MSERSTAYLKHRKLNEIVEAVLIDDISREEVAQAQKSWEPTFASPGAKAQHSHWDWNDKYQLVVKAPLAFRIFGLEADKQIQGLMLVLTTGKFCNVEEHKGKPLIYIDYLATAPWNSADVVAEPVYSGVGKVLLRVACQLSDEEGFKGRIGLHSLPQAESWYRDVCLMTDLGEDKTYNNLRYFEMTPEQATRFTKG